MNNFAFICTDNNCDGMGPFIIGFMILFGLAIALVLGAVFFILRYIARKLPRNNSRGKKLGKAYTPFVVGYVLIGLIYYLSTVTNLQIANREELVLIPMVLVTFTIIFYLNYKNR
jgi:hypothetical protein